MLTADPLLLYARANVSLTSKSYLQNKPNKCKIDIYARFADFLLGRVLFDIFILKRIDQCSVHTGYDRPIDNRCALYTYKVGIA